MKSLLQLHISVLVDLGRQCSTDVARDIQTVTKRCEDEGDSLLTITLPAFAKALERGLELGQWPERGVLPSWRYVRGLPAFLRGFLLGIFDSSGHILDEPSPDCIRAVRQFCLLSQKVKRECTPERVKRAFSGFIDTDVSLIGLPGRIDPARLSLFEKATDQLFGDLLRHLDNQIANYQLVPKHGPGAVAEKLSQLEKRDYSYWTERLERVFPYWRYTRNTGYASGRLIAPSDEHPVRVITVPKTQSTPRIIAVEPSSVQYAQQGLKREIYEFIGRSPLSGILGFQDQERNRKMAEAASSSQEMATLDLSEASDRVHWYLVYVMFRRYPHLWDFVWATRSAKADVNGEVVIPLQKFASMGSALTFPIEAMVFTTLAALGMKERGSVHAIRVSSLKGALSVFGDDIIVPVHAVDSVIDWLEHFGAKVNHHKSFWIGKFRESCGAEYYDGHDVSVVRVRSELPSSRNDAANIAAYIDLRNRFFQAGLWGVVKDIDEALDKLISVPYVYASLQPEAGFLSRTTYNRSAPNGERFNPHLQRSEFRAPVLVPTAKPYRVDGEAGLLEWFHDVLRSDDLRDRFESKERATSFNIKRRWTPVLS